MKAKLFNTIVLIGFIIGMVLFATPTIYVDPYFHYHAPIDELYYPIKYERYQNNGITRNFIYDAMITGTSMTENFKVSEFNKIFGVNSIKVPYSGGSYKEINSNILVALQNNKDLKIIIRGIDYTGLMQDKDYENYEARPDYPHYLNDNNVFNDVSYVLNKEILYMSKTILENDNMRGIQSFDDYGRWNDDAIFGKEEVLNSYTRVDKSPEVFLTEEEKEKVRENIWQNIVSTATQYPDTTFYLFFSPYGICYWDELKQSGKLNYHIEAERVAIEEILKCDNIKLFSFSNNFEWTCNLDNYKDQAHYGEWINSAILKNMYAGRWRLTEENYREYIREIREFYSNYDYDEIYKL